MEIRGRPLLAVARACGKADDKPDEVWTEFVHLVNVGSQTRVEATDGEIAARYTMDTDSTLACCLAGADANRLYGKDEVHVESVTRAGRRAFTLSAGAITADLVSDDGKDQTLTKPYPDLDDLVFNKRPMKQIPAFACKVKALKGALAILSEAGSDVVTVFPGRNEDDPVFLVGISDHGREMEVAVRRGVMFGRKEQSPPVTEAPAPAPMFDGTPNTPAPVPPKARKPRGVRRMRRAGRN